MHEFWKRFEGEVVDGSFPLRECVAADDDSAVFLTEYGEEPRQQGSIKLIYEDPETSKLQLARWEAASQLSHPGLIRLLAGGTCKLQGSPLLYLVMERAEESLAHVIPHRALTTTEALQILNSTVAALAYVHKQGFVHCRVKPENIVAVGDALRISSDSVCRVGDTPPVRKPGVYDPPEIRGQGLSPAGDMWSLGITLVEALTRERPVWSQTELDEPQIPDTLEPPFLEIACECLRRDPQSRATAAQIAARLGPDAPAPKLAAARQAPAVAAPRATSSRRRYLLVAAGLVLVAAIAGSSLLKRQPGAEVASEVEQPAVVEQSRVRDESQRSAPPVGQTDKPVAPVEPERKPAAPEVEQLAASSAVVKEEASAAVKQEASRVGTAASASPPPSPARAAETQAISSEVVPGKVVQQILPEVPAKARNTIEGRVRVNVNVRVDPSGRVERAEALPPIRSKYFTRLAEQAALEWEFTPAKRGGQPVASDWTLRFEFRRTSTKADPTFLSAPN